MGNLSGLQGLDSEFGLRYMATHQDLAVIVIHVQLIRTHKLSFQGYELSICVDKLFLHDLVRNDTDPSPTFQFAVQANTDPCSAFCHHLVLLSCACLVIDPRRVDSLMVE